MQFSLIPYYMKLIAIALIAFLMVIPVWGVENNGAYIKTQPTISQVPNWTIGWPGTGVTGWNYVGSIGSASAVYLSNGWVITAAHVGAGNFVLGSTTYNMVPGSVRPISNTNSSTVDLVMFQIQTRPNLLPLPIATTAPVPFFNQQAGTTVVMLGIGGGSGLTWGYDTITEINQWVTPGGYTYVSNDFFTDNGTTTYGTSSITNTSNLVGGDSGGGDFSYNAALKEWQLIGINEVTGTYSNPPAGSPSSFSGMVQLSTYAAEINFILIPPNDSPTMPPIGVLILGAVLFLIASSTLKTRVFESGNDRR